MSANAPAAIDRLKDRRGRRLNLCDIDFLPARAPAADFGEARVMTPMQSGAIRDALR
jgi:hypothetical protein